jgi:preprotein translocase subunit SecF
MAWRLRLAPEKTNIDFFRLQWITFGLSAAAMVLSLVAWAALGLNFGVDFLGGTTIRTNSTQEVDIGAYRNALEGLGLGDVTITEVLDPTFAADQNVTQVRISAQDGQEAVTPETVDIVERALRTVDPEMTFPSVESVGPKVSSELIQKAFLSIAAASVGIGIYIWLRFEWQYSVGTVVALVHDVLVLVGIWALFQLKFDLNIVAALLTTLGYSVNDTVVVFDRLRENLLKYKAMPLRDVMNLSVNETLSRTIVTGGTTLLALIPLLIFGGDVIRGFILNITLGVFIGTYSSVYVAKNIVLWIGLPRGEGAAKRKSRNEFADVDA